MIYRSLLRPLLFRLPPETAHELALHTLPLISGLLSSFRHTDQSIVGPLKRFGLTFSNPVGVAAGFDKNGIVLRSLAALGFGHIEAGTVTYQPQPGNPRPRLFRLPLDKGLINRAGFNNDGAVAFAERFDTNRPKCVVGVSIGRSKAVPAQDAVADYLQSFRAVYNVADYIAVNVSSPNTPGLRQLQKADQLEELLNALQRLNDELAKQKSEQRLPVLIKLAPDLEQDEVEAIVGVAQKTGIAGIIATNTTVSRDGLRTPAAVVAQCGEGGLSGLPIRLRSSQMIANLYRLTEGTIQVIGVGGIIIAKDAWEKICAGASLVQLYTGLIYQGPSIARRINEGLAEILKRENLSSLDQAVGANADKL